MVVDRVLSRRGRSPIGDLALRRAMLAERRAGATLGYTQLTANVLDANPATRGAVLTSYYAAQAEVAVVCSGVSGR